MVFLSDALVEVLLSTKTEWEVSELLLDSDGCPKVWFLVTGGSDPVNFGVKRKSGWKLKIRRDMAFFHRADVSSHELKRSLGKTYVL